LRVQIWEWAFTGVRDKWDLDGLEDVRQREVAAVEGAPTGNDSSTGSELLLFIS
jgi:hypothetical protein